MLHNMPSAPMHCALCIYSTSNIASGHSKTFLLEGHEMKLQVKYRWERLCFFNALGCFVALLAFLTSEVMLCTFSYSQFCRYFRSSRWERYPLLQLILPHFWDVSRCGNRCHGLGERDTPGYGGRRDAIPQQDPPPIFPFGQSKQPWHSRVWPDWQIP